MSGIISGDELRKAAARQFHVPQSQFISKEINGHRYIEYRPPYTPPQSGTTTNSWQAIKFSGLKFQIQFGTVNSVEPTNWSITQTADAGTVSTPVIYYYWLQLNLSGLTSGTIVSSSSYQFGQTPPSPYPSGWDGSSIPSTYNYLLGYVVTTDTTIISSNQSAKSSILVGVVQNPKTCAVSTYSLTITPAP